MLSVGENQPRFVCEDTSDFREPDLSFRAGEQRRTKFLFKLANLLAQWRLAHAQPLGCASEIQGVGERYGVAEVSQFHGG